MRIILDYNDIHKWRTISSNLSRRFCYSMNPKFVKQLPIFQGKTFCRRREYHGF